MTHSAFGERRRERVALVRDVEADVRETAKYLGFDRLPEAVRAALLRVPRHAFVPLAVQAEAYANQALPIGEGQTISQPYIVAIMTALARAGPGKRILEVGCGCGYQAAVLAETGARVFSLELLPGLAQEAAERLRALGYGPERIALRQGDGRRGWAEEAPFDAILVTASPEQVPPFLIAQLAPGGRLVIPVGPRSGLNLFASGQYLRLIEKSEDGGLRERDLLPVAFVPLVAPHGPD